MDIQSRKLTFIQEFLLRQNEDIILGLEKMLKKHKSIGYEESLKPMSMEQFNADFDQSLEDLANDNVISARDLK